MTTQTKEATAGLPDAGTKEKMQVVPVGDVKEALAKATEAAGGEDPLAHKVGLPIHPLMPSDLNARLRMAEIIAQSPLCPDGYKETNDAKRKEGYYANVASVFIALTCGAELGLGPFQSMQSVDVIQGRPSVRVQTMLGVASATGLLAEHWLEWSDDAGGTCKAFVRRKGKTRLYEGEFSWERAQAANLTGKNNWKGYKPEMLRARALVRALKEAFAELFVGLSTPEEAEDAAASEATATPARVVATWEMGPKEMAELKSLGMTKKIPLDEQQRLLREATGGRAIAKRTVDEGFVLELEKGEFERVRAALKAWKPASVEAPAPAKKTEAATAPASGPAKVAAPHGDPEKLGDGPPSREEEEQSGGAESEE